MKIEFIERLIQLAEHSGLEEMEFAEGGVVVRFKLASNSAPAAFTAQPVEQTAQLKLSSEIAATRPLTTSDQNVISSLGGVFYRAPSPDDKPFVEVGDLVEEGQTLAIIEAMKMLNPIESPSRGRVSAILIIEGEMVEAGSPLFTISEES